MSEENVDIVRQVIESNRSDDIEAQTEAALALWDPSCEHTPNSARLDSQTYRGHDGLRSYVSDMVDLWAEWRSEVEEVFEVRPDTVIATFRSRFIGKGSGLPVEARLGAVFVLSHGKILRGQVYPSRQEALKAAGLAE